MAISLETFLRPKIIPGEEVEQAEKKSGNYDQLLPFTTCALKLWDRVGLLHFSDNFVGPNEFIRGLKTCEAIFKCSVITYVSSPAIILDIATIAFKKYFLRIHSDIPRPWDK